MQIKIDSTFWELFPEAQISVLVVKGLDNHIDESKDPHFQELLDEASKKAESFITEEPFTSNTVIQEWREAFTKFKTKKRGKVVYWGATQKS